MGIKIGHVKQQSFLNLKNADYDNLFEDDWY